LVSAETSSIDLDARHKDAKKDEDTKEGEVTTELSETEAKDLCDWMLTILGRNRVREVRTVNRVAAASVV
jgi:hypothetical protein